MKLKRRLTTLFIAFFIFGLPSAFAQFPNNNLHLIDSDSKTGFALYRSGEPNQASFDLWCSLGIRQVMVLSGTADTVEVPMEKRCPQLKVIYNSSQDDYTPLTPEFLHAFEAWVADARLHGTKILFRCNCGCHRTGRLAAYYRMRYMGWNANRAIQEMESLAVDMDKHAYLLPEVRALEDYIHGRTCSQVPQFCGF